MPDSSSSAFFTNSSLTTTVRRGTTKNIAEAQAIDSAKIAAVSGSVVVAIARCVTRMDRDTARADPRAADDSAASDRVAVPRRDSAQVIRSATDPAPEPVPVIPVDAPGSTVASAVAAAVRAAASAGVEPGVPGSEFPVPGSNSSGFQFQVSPRFNVHA